MSSRQSTGEPRLLISRRALAHNLAVIREQCNPRLSVCAMVKADAYGHDAKLVVETLCQPPVPGHVPVDHLGVATIEEAMALPIRDRPVHVFRPVENVFSGRQTALIRAAIDAGYILTLLSPSAAVDLARVAQRHGKRAMVQVMIDTGMTRCGASPEQAVRTLGRVASLPPLRLHSVCTHFATADEPASAFVAEQLLRFDSTVATAGLHGVPRHAANSGAIFFQARTHYEMVRPGISLYGIDPTGRVSSDRPLRPVARWLAPIVAIHEVAAGTTVGYSRTWTATRDSRIGLVPVGYADGYFRGFGNRAVMLVHGVSCPVVGRVSMDLSTIDLTDVPAAAIGDDVVVMDSDPLSPCSVYKLAEWMGTIPYEVLTRIGPRVRRIAVDPDLDPGDARPDTDAGPTGGSR